ncbi:MULTISPECIES: TonB-dependent receptor [unclassified Duganella]|uniref:TonB-dependent receptor n=1 Tax=unclassified Duganella TaxID=2636909 RepID=UPI000E349CF3|nr:MULTISPECIES: TonB-dependent receptor [unclassified Duganella]RFP09263.1 TonB-dependent receptor [Duganella sp. BJB475]RFP25298.1 TonB-dependent receptor [Duganella sp. BJB476]
MNSVGNKRYYLGWAAALGAASAGAQDAAPDTTPVAVVVVEGKRASLMTAQQIKRGQLAIVDSVVADAIQTLPDFSVTDALQRVTGVQIARDRGEGANVAIRGLTQMETTLNGREVFTAGTGRNLDFADVPAELVAGIDVYKSAAAEQIEGGLGGTIDLRTRRPFDFAGRQLAGTARLVRDELAQHTQPQWSLLASDRWRAAGGAEFGALLSLVHQRRAWREDQNSFGAPVLRGDLIPGRQVEVAGGTTESASAGRRQRDAAAAALQWRPAPGLELYAEGRYEQFLTRQDTYQITLGAPPSFAPGSVTLFDGTSDVSGINWTGASASILSFARDTVDRNRSLAVGGSWRGGALRLKADLSHSDSHNALYFAGPTLTGSALTLRTDLAGPQPAVTVPGNELRDPARLQVASIAYRYRPFDGKLNALQLDASYGLGAWLESLSAGVRIGRRDAANGAGLVLGDAPVAPGLSLSAVPSLAAAYPFSSFFPDGGQGPSNYLVGSLNLARDAAALRRLVGLNAPLPVAGSALGVWRINENTNAAYVQARFNGGPLPLEGNAGLRLVRTYEAVEGNQSLPSGGAIVPIAIDHAYRDYLPSLNLRYGLGPDLYLRGAASKSVTRPNFDQLSPSLTLTPNSITPISNSGSAGNPALQPIRANNVDLALERYLGPAASATVTVFYKRVTGFISSASQQEIHDGAVYQVTRPYNSANAIIKGAELSYQQMYDFLPGWLSGLGMQANYTLVDSATPSSLLGADVPLANLSRHSANLVGIYEGGPWSARLAYNWRDKFLSSINTYVGLGALPIYSEGYGWLDASLSYKVSPTLTLSMEGNNLLRTVRSANYGSPTRPQSLWTNDRQWSATALFRF